MLDDWPVTTIVISDVRDGTTVTVGSIPVIVAHFARVTEAHLLVTVSLGIGLVFGVVLELVNFDALRGGSGGGGRCGSSSGSVGSVSVSAVLAIGTGRFRCGCVSKIPVLDDFIEVEKKRRLTGRWRNGYPLAAEDAEFAFRISGVLEHVVVVVSRPEAVLAGDQTVLICRDTRIGIF